MTCPCAWQTAKPKATNRGGRPRAPDRGMGHIPDSDIDLFSDAALPDPYPRYRRLRDLGLVVAQRHRHNRSGPPSPLVSEHATNTAPGPAAPL